MVHILLVYIIQILTGAEVMCWSRLTVDICFVISLSKIRDRVCTLPYWPIQTRNSHTFNSLETYVPIFASDYIIFVF